MKRITVLALLLLSGCQTSNTSVPLTAEELKHIRYVDMRHLPIKTQADGYWIQKRRIEPIYPIEAAKGGISGCVSLMLGITPDGRVGSYKITSSYPEGVFDISALQAIKKWRWIPDDNNPARQAILIDAKLDYFVIQGQKNLYEAKRNCEFTSIPGR